MPHPTLLRHACRYVMPSLQPYGGAGWVASCLLPPSALSLFTHVLIKQETVQAGLTWATLWEPVTVDYPFRWVGTCLLEKST